MTAPRLLACGALALIASISAGYAGPCTEEISNMQATSTPSCTRWQLPGRLVAKEALVRTFNRHRDQSVLPRKSLARCRLKRLRLSEKPCCVRAPPIALVTKTRANKHSRKCKVR